MKKIISASAIAVTPLIVNAQSFGPGQIDHEVFSIVATIAVVGLFMLFIITIMKRIMDFKLKNKIIEKGIPENIIESLLQANPRQDGNINVKWFAMLAGLGAALIIINYTRPLGIHSLAIMAFCMAAGFLGYYLFTRYSEK